MRSCHVDCISVCVRVRASHSETAEQIGRDRKAVCNEKIAPYWLESKPYSIICGDCFPSQAKVSSFDRWQKPIEKVLKTLSWAPQRWNSESTPLRRFAALLLPIALLLAIQSTDQRQSKPFRQKCHNLLSKFQPAFLVNVGLQADYSAELLRFLRIFDCSDHDPAKTYREKSNFASRLLGSPGNLVISD